MFKKSIIALSLISVLTGCSLDGDDGQTALKDYRENKAQMELMG